MSFYRRYGSPPVIDVGRGGRPVDPLPVGPGPVVPAIAPRFPPVPLEIQSFSPRTPQDYRKPPMFDPRTAQSFLPPRKVRTVQASVVAEEPTGQKMVFTRPAAQAPTEREGPRRGPSARTLQKDEPQPTGQTMFPTPAVTPKEAGIDIVTPPSQQVWDGGGGGGGGGGGIPYTAEELAALDPNAGAPPVGAPPAGGSNPLLFAAAGAAGGLALGGKIGALVGGIAGYFFGSR